MCFFFLCPLWCPCLCIIFSAALLSRVGFIPDEHLDGSVRHLLDLRFGLPDDVGISSSFPYLMENFDESLKPASSHIQFKTLCSIKIEGESNNIAQQLLRQQQQQQQEGRRDLIHTIIK